MVRVVVDTNVLVSALVNRGKPRRLVLRLLESHSLVLSRQMLAELADVLSRGKFAVSGSQTDRFIFGVVRKSKLVTVRSRSKRLPKTQMTTWFSIQHMREKQAT